MVQIYGSRFEITPKYRQGTVLYYSVVTCVSCHPVYSGRQVLDVPAGVTQDEGYIGFLHLPSAVLALTFLARRSQPFLSLVDREVEFCVLTN